MHARSLARRFALSLGLPLALAAGAACKKSEPQRERPNRPAASIDHEAQCERGTFCVPPQPAIEVSAPPPFERCSVVHPLPAGVPAGWEQPRRAKLRIMFHKDTTAAARKTDPETCCYEWWEHCAGRPLRAGAGAVVAAAVPGGGGWAGAARALEMGRSAEAAAHWVENALLEHAPIAAFAKLALDLLALGAPPDLVAGAHAAALDEVRHAQVSFAIAASLGAAATGPGPLPEAARSLGPVSAVTVLRETFRDGCIGEAAAALVLAKAARRAGGPLAEALSGMAEDEARHAELGWRTVLWLVRAFPDAADALRVEVSALREEASAPCAVSVHERAAGRSGRGAARLGVWSAGEMRKYRMRSVCEIAVPLAEAMLLCPGE